METCDLLEKWRYGVKNGLVHLSESQRGQKAHEGGCHTWDMKVCAAVCDMAWKSDQRDWV